MLQFFRKAMASPIALGVLGLVIIAFIITGVGDPFAGSAGRQGTVAVVGDRTLVEADLQRALDRVLQNAREQNPSATLGDIARDGAVPLVADQLIGQAAIEEYASTLGLGASDRAIGAVIAGIPAFQIGGKFDQATYDRLLSEQRLSDKQLREEIAGDILRKQLLTPLTASLGVPAGMATPLAQQLVDIHRGRVALVPPGAETPASEAEVTRFYEANRNRFSVPERRAFRWAEIDRAKLAEAAKVNDAAIADAYAKNPARYGAAGTRKLLQVVVPEEATARAITAAAPREGFAKAAQRLAGFGAADIAIGEKSEADLARETSAAVARAAFALPAPGAVSAPVKSDFGWHVLSLEAMGAPAKTLDQARPAIIADLAERASADALSDLVARIEDSAEDGKSFADIAAAEGLTINSQTPVASDGAQLDAGPLTGRPATLAPRAFQQLPDDGITVQTLEDGAVIVLETTQVVPSSIRPLAEIKPLVAALAARDKAVQAARAKADAIVAAVSKGTDFTKAVTDAGLPAPQPLSGRRVDAMQMEAVPPIIQAFLTTAAGKTRVLAGLEGWALIHVDSVVAGDLAQVPGIVDAMRREVAAQLPTEFAAAVAAASQRALKVERNDKTIEALTRRLGSPPADADGD
ncbi:SurA N-terminal domain-containing protein [Polymorphobacter sp.]|uniref:peptidylprolyl isomerase n=1 Tax=Polymorphobacter sp. TaxID=1909290 RepID=UPI003F6F51FA